MQSTRITAEAIDPSELLRAVADEEAGAVLLFLGTVRRLNEGRLVAGMRYDAYAAMAEEVLRAIVAEATARWQVAGLAAVHRTGDLGLGDVSVAIAVATPHREQAYAASRYVIDEIKRRLPVWKEEHYETGDRRWLDGQLPPVPGS